MQATKPPRLPGEAGRVWKEGLAKIVRSQPGAPELWDRATRLALALAPYGIDDRALLESLEFVELVEEYARLILAGETAGAKGLVTVRCSPTFRAALNDEAHRRRLSMNELCNLVLADALIPGEWRPDSWTARSDRLTSMTRAAQRHAERGEPAGVEP